jgi:hypothetical protein
VSREAGLKSCATDIDTREPRALIPRDIAP